ncbi:MAG TPA: hypothetical protein ENL12_03945, partial [Dehalococcoidia bacterium]|nr:hypothetical protein [Dehalococcoidia bacterium]
MPVCRRRTAGARCTVVKRAGGSRPGDCMKIFVGNLSFDADEHDLEGLFAAFGHVGKVTLARHPRSRHSRGFGFVEMPDAAEAERAIAAL